MLTSGDMFGKFRKWGCPIVDIRRHIGRTPCVIQRVESADELISKTVNCEDELWDARIRFEFLP